MGLEKGVIYFKHGTLAVPGYSRSRADLIEDISTSCGTITRVTLGPGDSFKHLPETKTIACQGCGAPGNNYKCEYCGG